MIIDHFCIERLQKHCRIVQKGLSYCCVENPRKWLYILVQIASSYYLSKFCNIYIPTLFTIRANTQRKKKFYIKFDSNNRILILLFGKNFLHLKAIYIIYFDDYGDGRHLHQVTNLV